MNSWWEAGGNEVELDFGDRIFEGIRTLVQCLDIAHALSGVSECVTLSVGVTRLSPLLLELG